MAAEAEKPQVIPKPVRKKAKKPAQVPAPVRAGSLQEIERGPSGKSIAAIFDFDGTLIAGYSALDVAQSRIIKGQVSAREIMGLASLAARGAMGQADFNDLIAFMAANWKGKKESELMAEGERLFHARLVDRLYPEMKRRMEAHRAKGHTLILASSATAFQVEPAAKYLGIDHVLCTRFEVKEGRMTGRPLGATLWSEGKANAVKALAKNTSRRCV